ncbi:hypothetical protein D3C76_1403220 [compost metagenome]
MKIVNRQDFLSMPAGTLFAKYSHSPIGFGEIQIKGESSLVSGDFLKQSLLEMKFSKKRFLKDLRLASTFIVKARMGPSMRNRCLRYSSEKTLRP